MISSTVSLLKLEHLEEDKPIKTSTENNGLLPSRDGK